MRILEGSAFPVNENMQEEARYLLKSIKVGECVTVAEGWLDVFWDPVTPLKLLIPTKSCGRGSLPQRLAMSVSA